MAGNKGNKSWIKGGPSPNPSGRKRRQDGGSVPVGGQEAMRMLASLRADGWENLVTGLGQQGYDKTIDTTFAVDPMDDATAYALWQGDDIGKRIIETWPEEMLRKPFEVRIGSAKAGEDPQAKDASEDPAQYRTDAAERRNKDVQDQLKKLHKKIGLMPALKRALEYREAYGGGAVLMGVDDEAGGLDKPLGKVIRDIRFLTPFEPRELQPLWYYNDATAPRYREVSHYQLNAVTAGPAMGGNAEVNVGQLIHESRLMLFGACPVSPGINMTLRPGWENSKFTSVWRVLRGFQSAWANTDNMLASFSIAIWKLKDLAMLVSQNNGQGAADLKSRMQLMAFAQSILRATVIDADEEFTHETRSFAGIHEILNLYMSRVCAAANMPMTRLFGTSPGGLDATGESDIEFFDDRVNARQEDELTPALEKLIRPELAMLGYIADDWCIYYPSLRQETDAEKATARKTQADTDAIYIDRGVLTPEEVTLHRFGGDEYSFETPLDLDARAIEQRAADREAKAAEEMQAQVEAAKATAEAKGGGKPAFGKKDALRLDFVRKKGSKYAVYSHSGEVLGEHDTEEEANKQLAAIEASKQRRRKDFDPDQPRDEQGRWGESGAGTSPSRLVKSGEGRIIAVTRNAEQMTAMYASEGPSVMEQVYGQGITTREAAIAKERATEEASVAKEEAALKAGHIDRVPHEKLMLLEHEADVSASRFEHARRKLEAHHEEAVRAIDTLRNHAQRAGIDDVPESDELGRNQDVSQAIAQSVHELSGEEGDAPDVSADRSAEPADESNENDESSEEEIAAATEAYKAQIPIAIAKVEALHATQKDTLLLLKDRQKVLKAANLAAYKEAKATKPSNLVKVPKGAPERATALNAARSMHEHEVTSRSEIEFEFESVAEEVSQAAEASNSTLKALRKL